MIEVIDREPLGNKKNNRMWIDIPENVTTVAQLVALLRDGCFADVFANNDTTGENVGVAVKGTPLNRYLFTSIDEGGGSDNGELADIVACSGEKSITAAWNYVPFPRALIQPPKVVAVPRDATEGLSLSVKDITEEGFYVAAFRASVSTVSTTVYSAAGTAASSTHSAVSVVNSVSLSRGNFVACNIQYIAMFDGGIDINT